MPTSANNANIHTELKLADIGRPEPEAGGQVVGRVSVLFWAPFVRAYSFIGSFIGSFVRSFVCKFDGLARFNAHEK